MPKRNLKIDYSAMASTSAKVWKETPPGPEQKELDRLFSNGLIDDSDTPNAIRQTNPIFMTFSAKVFGVHFRKTKARHGLYANTNDNKKEDEASEKISELGWSSESHVQSQIPSSSAYNTDEICMEFENAPYITWIYTDHIRKCDFVCVALPIISGSRDINFNLSEDGMKLSISYTWPSALYKPLELFHDEINKANDKISLDHPKVHAFTSHLLECGITEKSNPKGNIIISLPTKVQREAGSWKKSGIKSNDTKIVFLEFKAYQKTRIIEDADTSVTFD